MWNKANMESNTAELEATERNDEELVVLDPNHVSRYFYNNYINYDQFYSL